MEPPYEGGPISEFCKRVHLLRDCEGYNWRDCVPSFFHVASSLIELARMRVLRSLRGRESTGMSEDKSTRNRQRGCWLSCKCKGWVWLRYFDWPIVCVLACLNVLFGTIDAEIDAGLVHFFVLFFTPALEDPSGVSLDLSSKIDINNRSYASHILRGIPRMPRMPWIGSRTCIAALFTSSRT